jgi:hypothetical protein
MAYDDPYYPPTTKFTNIETDEMPPEADDSRANPRFVIAAIAGGLILLGLVIGVAVTRSSSQN